LVLPVMGVVLVLLGYPVPPVVRVVMWCGGLMCVWCVVW